MSSKFYHAFYFCFLFLVHLSSLEVAILLRYAVCFKALSKIIVALELPKSAFISDINLIRDILAIVKGALYPLLINLLLMSISFDKTSRKVYASRFSINFLFLIFPFLIKLSGPPFLSKS